MPSQPGHAWLAQHYRWGLGRAFDRKRGHSHVVVVEDDMVFSPDFLLFFQVQACSSRPPFQGTAMNSCAYVVNFRGNIIFASSLCLPHRLHVEAMIAPCCCRAVTLEHIMQSGLCVIRGVSVHRQTCRT